MICYFHKNVRQERRNMILPLYDDELSTDSSTTVVISSSTAANIPVLVTTEGVDEYIDLEPAWKTEGFELLKGVDAGAWFLVVVVYLTLFFLLRFTEVCCCRGEIYTSYFFG